MKITEKVAIVTGGAQGIGEHVCRAILERGGKVAVLDKDEERGVLLKDKLENQYGYGRVIFIVCDVTSSIQMKDSFKKTKDAFGQINIVCNNAGIVSENEIENWNEIVDVNLKGVILGQFLAILYMGVSNGGEGGTIVNVSSMAARRNISNGHFANYVFGINSLVAKSLAISPMSIEQSIYTATKYGVLGLTQSSKELYLKEKIRVNCVCPSITATQMSSRLNEHYNRGNPELFNYYSKLGLISPELVANGVIELIEDESKHASVMAITKKRGIQMLKASWALTLNKSHI
ncbi:15-hydroxyprostaglandin dehydrogenase [NAD(+)]-like isoform X1 [Acropora millepora]|uniref:15-hydroxyprostaglandin dehydrogenase [NAD(+)]-like isoform X1 n=1 Tax=Acropora millepora TaxID=45264 RepID=UPI001CF57442|nr:15-hydroxyprostaglandin dehydrogenase [NAD(+)]-like isoform X1 [Acropora millepora]